MSIQDEISHALTEAECQLISRLRKALDEREYGDVAQLAWVSQQVRELIRAIGGNDWSPKPGDSARVPTLPKSEARDSIPRRPRDSTRRRQVPAYPRFARDGDRLVKIGWSKRDHSEYEHRAPEFVVSTITSALRELGSSEFSMDKLTPLRNEDGKDVPSYQVYLVLAWLRACGAVRKARPGGYVPIPEGLTVAAVNENWAALDAGTA